MAQPGHDTAPADKDGAMSDEEELRERLGIPAEAREVLVVTESTHWDPDWLLTSTEYLRLMVAPTLDRALDALVAEPRRVFSVECTFYPEAYLRRSPDRRESFVALANEGRLRFTGSGVTTPDTLLPTDEMLLRDLLEGSEWLRRLGITREPRSLYLPDSFGHSPGVPALLRTAGVDYAAVCRIDGMRFPGAELEAADHFPWPGTSAARLVDEGTADFVWRSPDGSEVLTHWHAFGYGHGDMIGHDGITRVMGLPLAWSSRDPGKVATRIEEYLRQLRPLSRTPYHLLAIGFDFSRPVPGLVDLLDSWNASGYDRTGVWALNAGLDDYLDLVATQRDRLPTIELDPNPYWTGFYATRPALKRACRDLGRDLVTLDALRTRRLGDAGRADGVGDRRCDDARWIAATANHHDLITGTSPDRTTRLEQWPWLDGAHREVTDALRELRHTPSVDPATTPSASSGPDVRRDGRRVTVTTPHFVATFDAARGGTLVSLTDRQGTELVNRGTLSCVAIAERGGLWRMGHEFPGGRWRPVDATVDHPATVEVSTTPEGTVVAITATLESRDIHLTVTFDDAEPFIGVETLSTPRVRRTILLQWRAATRIDGLVMHQPGAVVTRPLHKRFEPTFWPLHSWAVTMPSGRDAEPVAIATGVPTALHALATGTVETVVARTAPRELAWGVVPLLGPAMGWERGAQSAHLAFASHRIGTPPHRTGRMLQGHVDRRASRTPPDWPFALDDPDVEIVTVKPADRGEGIIVRLRNWDVDEPSRTVRLSMGPDARGTIIGARRCDSNERDGADLTVTGRTVELAIDAHLMSVRLSTRGTGGTGAPPSP